MLVAPYLTLMTEDAPQRDHPLREVFNGALDRAHRGAVAPDAARPAALGHRALADAALAACGRVRGHRARPARHLAAGRGPRRGTDGDHPGRAAGYDGAKRRKGSKAHLAVDTLGHLLALCVTAADAQERAG